MTKSTSLAYWRACDFFLLLLLVLETSNIFSDQHRSSAGLEKKKS